MEYDGRSRKFSFGVLTGEVKARHGTFAIPYLTNFEGEQFTDPQARTDTQNDPCAIPQSMATFQPGQRETVPHPANLGRENLAIPLREQQRPLSSHLNFHLPVPRYKPSQETLALCLNHPRNPGLLDPRCLLRPSH